MSLNYQHIEAQARLLQVEVWNSRDLLYTVAEPPPLQVLSPENAARICGLEYEYRPNLDAEGDKSNFKAAGMLDRGRGIISISTEFSYETQRFTGGHEIGHFVLHTELGFRYAHRDRPLIDGLGGPVRSQIEREADYFSACFLAPRKLVLQEFQKRFGRIPLTLTEHLAFHLRGKHAHLLLTASPGSIDFAVAVAGAKSLDGRHFPSMAKHFGLSVPAMAVRLRELGLIRE